MESDYIVLIAIISMFASAVVLVGMSLRHKEREIHHQEIMKALENKAKASK